MVVILFYMPTKCILARTDELLLGSIVEDLLIQGDDLELTEIIGKSKNEVIDAIDRLHPDVLVLCRKTHDTITSNFMQLLQDYPDLLIITVSTDDNYMHIYGKQKVLITQSSDILSVIQSH